MQGLQHLPSPGMTVHAKSAEQRHEDVNTLICEKIREYFRFLKISQIICREAELYPDVLPS